MRAPASSWAASSWGWVSPCPFLMPVLAPPRTVPFVPHLPELGSRLREAAVCCPMSLCPRPLTGALDPRPSCAGRRRGRRAGAPAGHASPRGGSPHPWWHLVPCCLLVCAHPTSSAPEGQRVQRGESRPELNQFPYAPHPPPCAAPSRPGPSLTAPGAAPPPSVPPSCCPRLVLPQGCPAQGGGRGSGREEPPCLRWGCAQVAFLTA